MKFELFVGIDIGKEEFFAALSRGNDEKPSVDSFKNNPEGIQKFLGWIKRLNIPEERILVCMENTGAYLEKLVTSLDKVGVFSWIVNATVIKNSQVNINRLKNDKADAEKILYFSIIHQIRAKRYVPKIGMQQELSDLALVRRQLISERQKFMNFSESNKDKAQPSEYSEEIYSDLIGKLSEKIQKVEARIQELIKKEPDLNQQYNILISIPGLGPVNAVSLILITEGFKKIEDWKKMASMIGSAPFEFSSGTSVRKKTKTSKKGNRKYKAILYMGLLAQISPGRKLHPIYDHSLSKDGAYLFCSINDHRSGATFGLG